MYEVEIRNGLELFDEKLGRDVWLSRVEPELIHMNSCVNCVAAQAVGGVYAEALVILGLVPQSEYDKARENPSYPVPDKVAVLEAHYGFEIVHNEYGERHVSRLLANYATLQREWRATISAMKIPGRILVNA